MAGHRPRATGTQHHLPFHELSWEQFEELCQVLLNEATYSNVRQVGGAGPDDGIDLLATSKDGRRAVVQCKRYSKSFGVGEARQEIEKLDKLTEPFELYLLIVSHSVTAQARRAFEDAARGRFDFEYWDFSEVDRRAREGRAAERFFQLPTESKRRRFNLPVRNGYFEGRDKDLADLAERLRKRRAAAITQAITGLGGIGKTQTAIEYCYRHCDTYQDLFWCDASSVENLQRDYAVAAQTIGLVGAEVADDKAAAAFLTWLADRTSPWLVVLDNADDPDQVVDLVPRGPKGHVLVTSRAAHLPNFGAADPIILDVLSRDEALAFLLQRSGREQDEAASELIDELGRLPLAIEQAAAYLSVHRTVSIRQYLDAFNARRLVVLEKAKPGEGSYHSTVAATWRLNIEEVEDGSPAAAEVMRGLAFVAPDAIPVELIHMGLSCFGRVAQEVAGAAEGDTLEIAAQIVEPLTRYSLLRSDDARGSTLAIHRLVQEVIRSSLDAEGAQSCWSAALQALETIAPEGRGDDSSSWPAWRAVVGHVIAHAGLIEPADFEPPGLWHRASWFAWQSGAYRDSQRLCQRELQVLGRVLGEEHPSTLTAMANLAATLGNLGEWSEARTLEEQVVQVSRRVLGEEHPDTLTAMANLASTLRNQGEWSEARTLEEQVVQVRRKVLGEEHPDTLTAMANLASTLRDQGEWSEARTLFEQVEQVRRRVLGEEHPSTLTAMANLASTLWNQGEWSEARTLEEQVVQVSRRVLGEEHPSTLTTMANLASTLWNQGEWSEARTLFEQVVQVSRSVLGEEHPSTLTAMANLASTLWNQGEWSEARTLFEQVVQVSRRVFGEEHPDTLTAMANLASTLWNQGEWSKARILEEQVVQVRRRVLGEEHPDTLTAMNNLAHTLKNQGEWAEAKTLFERVVEAFRRVVGPEHPHTKAVEASLVSLLEAIENASEI